MPRHTRHDVPRKVSTRKTGSANPPHVRLLLADPHDIMLAGARQVLERVPGFKVIGQATTAAAVMSTIEKHTVLIRAIEAVCDGHIVFDRHIFLHFAPQLCNQAAGKQGGARADLSVQEQRVMALVTEGKTNKEIAVALGLSDKTVKNYLYRVYDKLRVTRRAQATKTFIERTRAAGAFGVTDFGCPFLSPRSLSTLSQN
ncbi:MAG: response regulator transcription factor [Nitrospira sp.]|nr:response regulator transcription factor [Nitrospira sp.]